MNKLLRTRYGIRERLTICMGAVICSTLASTVGHGQGLEYEVKPFVPQESSLVVTPTNGFAEAVSDAVEAGSFVFERGTTAEDLPAGVDLESFATVEQMSSAIKNIDASIYTDAAQVELESDELIASTPGDEGALPSRPDNYVEVRDITEADAAWLQLQFLETSLGGATISVSSPDTGRKQTLSEAGLREAGGTSVIFAGSTVRVEVQAPAGSDPPPLDELIKNVIVGTSLTPSPQAADEMSDPTGVPEHNSPDEEAHCGEDARVLTTHKFVARITPKKCTAFLIQGGLGVSAGHCLRKNRELLKLEFNVPPSDIDGDLSQAEVADTYGIAVDSILCSDCEPDEQLPGGLPHGQDWAVFRIANNTETGKSAMESQGGSFVISEVPQDASIDVVVLGYGLDDDPPQAGFSLQSAAGEYKGVDRQAANVVVIKHLVDTDSGNSGSPIVMANSAGEATEKAIGIHTGGWCSSDASKPNMGTSFLNEELTGAIESLSN